MRQWRREGYDERDDSDRRSYRVRRRRFSDDDQEFDGRDPRSDSARERHQDERLAREGGQRSPSSERQSQRPISRYTFRNDFPDTRAAIISSDVEEKIRRGQDQEEQRARET